MTPQERELITALLQRLRQTQGQPKDPEAEQLIRSAIAEQSDAPYYLVQTVLIQDMALHNAQSRIADLERQLAAARDAADSSAAAPQRTSFLGGLFGGGSGAVQAPAGSPPPGPWSRPAAAQQYQPQPQYQPQNPGYQPGYGAPPNWGGGSSGFLQSAATTAAGIAGGALLFEGIQSMFGSHAGGILSNASMQPGLSETVINNYYGSETAPPDQAADWGGGAPDQPVDTAADYTTEADNASDSDVGGSDADIGGGDDYV